MEFPRSDPPPSNYGLPLNFAQPSNFLPQGNFLPSSDNLAPTSYGVQQPMVPSFNPPSYQEMITRAIMVLNEKDGSSRQAIAKFIENEFRMAPSHVHSYELTQQLKRMKNTGQLILVKHSYMLPGSNNMMADFTVTQPQAEGSDGPKRKPGRPPKLQPNGGPMVSSGPPQPVGFRAAALGLGEPTIGVPTTSLFGGLTSGGLQFVGGNMSNVVTARVSDAPTMGHNGGTEYVGGNMSNDVTAPVSNAPTMGHNGRTEYDPGEVAMVVPIEQGDGQPAKRGRGRPRKVDTSMVGVEPESLVVSAGPDSAVQNNDGDAPPPVVVLPPPTVSGKRHRGRPAKFNMMMSVPSVNGGAGAKEGQGLAMVLGASKRGRGRPRKNVDGSIVVADGAGSGEVLPVAKKPRKSSGKPLGRPRKNVSEVASLTAEIQFMAYQGLKARVEHYQSRIKTAVSIVKPYLNETAVIALGALQDLEELANMDIISVPPANVQSAPIDDLNAPVNVEGAAAAENIQSAPFTAEAAPLNFQSTAETARFTFQSAPVSVQGHHEPRFQS